MLAACVPLIILVPGFFFYPALYYQGSILFLHVFWFIAWKMFSFNKNMHFTVFYWGLFHHKSKAFTFFFQRLLCGQKCSLLLNCLSVWFRLFLYWGYVITGCKTISLAFSDWVAVQTILLLCREQRIMTAIRQG